MIGIGMRFTALFVALTALVGVEFHQQVGRVHQVDRVVDSQKLVSFAAPDMSIQGTFVTNALRTPPLEWQGDPGNLPEGNNENLVLPGLVGHSYLVVRGADNAGTRIGGIDATGINPGDVRWLVNLPTGASPPTDSGTIAFIHEDTGSSPANRIQTPGATDCLFPIYAVAPIMYGGLDADGNNRWRILGDCGWVSRARALGQAFYPICSTPTLTGANNDYRPVCQNGLLPGFGLASATNDGMTYTSWYIPVDAGGASITGIYTSGSQADPLADGPTHFLINAGPGILTLNNLNGGSTVADRLNLPWGKDLILHPGEGIWLFSPFNKGTDLTAQWWAIGISTSNEYFPTVNTAGRTTTEALRETPALSPAALPAGLTSDYNPGDNAILRITANANGSYLDGLVPLGTLPYDGDTRIIINVGVGPLVLLPELVSVSAVNNRFILPGNSPITIPTGAREVVIYDTDGKWKLWDRGNTTANDTLTTVVTPANMAAADIDDWNPVDSVTGFDWRYAVQINSFGAVGTNLRTMNPPIQDNARFYLFNGGSGYTIIHNSATGTTGKPFHLAGGTNLVISQFGGVWIHYSAAAVAWVVEKPN
jgi:hypothetical protein